MEPEKLDQVIELLTRIDDKLSRLTLEPAQSVVDPPSTATAPVMAPPVVAPAFMTPPPLPEGFFTHRIGDPVEVPNPIPDPQYRVPMTEPIEPPTGPLRGNVSPWRESDSEYIARLEATRADTEFTLGGKVLPWAGGIGFVVGMITLVTMAVTRGWIGPSVQFGLAVLVCLGFIGCGNLAKVRGEFIGKLLTGLGICGLYLVLAGGYSTWKLFGGEVLVGSYTMLSLAVLGFGWKRDSKLLVCLGVVGGSIAALLPVDKGDVGAAMLINAAILLPAAVVVWRRQWLPVAAFLAGSNLFVAMLVAFAPNYEANWIVRMAFLLGCSLVGIAVLVEIPQSDDDQIPWSALAVGSATVATLASVVIHKGEATSIPLMIFAASLVGLGVLRRPRTIARDLSAAAGATIAIGVVPYMFDLPQTFLIQLGLCLLGFILAFQRLNRHIFAVGWLEFVLAATTYITILSDRSLLFLFGDKGAVLALFGALAFGTTLAQRFDFEDHNRDLLSWTFALTGWALVSRLGFLLGNTSSLTASWAIYGTALLPIGFSFGQRAFRYAGFLVLAVTLLKVMLIDLSDVDPAIRVVILIPLSIVLIGLSYVFYWGPAAKRLALERSEPSNANPSIGVESQDA